MVKGFFWWKKDNQTQKETPEDFLKKDHRKKEEITSTVVNYFSDGLLVFSRDSNLVLINPQAEKMLEVKKEQVLVKPIFELNSFPNFKPLVSLLGGEIREISRKEIQIKKRIIEVSSIPMTLEKEKAGTLVILHDVTREKLVEKMKTEFITLATHQLRTPTSAIKWSLRMLLEGDFGELSETQKGVLEKVYHSNEKTILLMRDLLNVAKIEEGRILSKMVLSNIEEIIQGLVAHYSEEIKRKKLKFEFKKPEKEVPKIMMDVDKMKIAIDNLIDNAVRYTPSGGKIKISLLIREKEIEVQIQDTGIGIPEDRKEKIFTKFFRAENAIKMEPEGTGLGLFMAKYIINAHGGRIWFESQEGEGTIFYLTFPIKKEFAEHIPPEFY